MSFEAKQSAANRIWVCLALVVLLLLFAETRGEKKPAYNLILNGGSECVGAQVYLDGAKAGAIFDSGDAGIGFVFRGHAAAGPHTVEVRKPSYKTFSKPIDMQREEYIDVDLEKASE